MTAAVARPPLFSHLVASRPDRDSGSWWATLLSVVLHAGVIVPIVLLSARSVAPPRETVVPILPEAFFPTAEPAQPSGGGSTPGRALPQPPSDLPMPPDIIPEKVMPGAIAVGERPDFFSALPVTGRTRGAGTGAGTGTGENPTDFVPITVAPELLNRAEVGRMLARYYPTQFQQAGIGGTVLVWLRLDESGAVMEVRVKEGSGYKALDAAALSIARSARFSPAWNRDVRVKVWVELPVIFAVR